MWFTELFGFTEESPHHVYKNLVYEDGQIRSLVNNTSYTVGQLEMPSLENLRKSINLSDFNHPIQVNEIVGDVQRMHQDIKNENALFQAASQFNLLEMVSPSVSPSEGIDGYDRDRTQGPACAIACGAGTVYRNYFVPHQSQHGQTNGYQIDCLANLGKELNNEELKLWKMSNGYALAYREGLNTIRDHIQCLTSDEYEDLMGKLNIGIQWQTQVTLNHCQHLVSQIYCSALPIAYCHHETYYWSDFAQLVLNATYEATLYAGLLNYQKTGCNKVYLTLVGGGAFGNHKGWIINAIRRCLEKFKSTPLEVNIVSYSQSLPDVKKLTLDYKV